MSMRQLCDLLCKVEPERELWTSAGNRTLTAGQLRSLLAEQQELRRRVRDRNVALFAGSESEMALLLVVLDGACRQIVLLPAPSASDRARDMIEQAGVELLVSTDPATEVAEGIEVCHFQPPELTEPAATDDATGTDFHTATRWVLPTSGTTGKPKLVSHTLSSLTRTTRQDLSRGKSFCWGSLYNLTGFAGLQVFLQSWFGGSRLILGQRDLPLEQRIQQFVDTGCTALSATPTMWRKLLMTSSAHRLQLKQITLGGEIVDQNILDALRHTFADANIMHIYASTEAGVGFGVRDGRAGFPASFLTEPPPGVRMSVDVDGRLLLGSDGNEQEYLDDGQSLKRDDGLIDTGDLLARREDRFFFLGRADGTINVGGNKVHPEEIESFLVACHGVQFARVRPKKSSFTGSLVQAEVVPESSLTQGADELRASLLTRCRSELEAYKVPAVLRVVDSIELTNSGKMKR